jgi:hypothetical protein
MKKIFTLIAVAAMALSANAQNITFTEAVAKGSMNGKTFGNDNFKLTSTDSNDKQEIDANPAYFGDATTQNKAEFRLKTGGKSDSKNTLTITTTKAGTLKIWARTGSNSATDRNVVVTQGSTELYNQVVKEADAVKVKGLDSADPDKETNVYPIISVSVAAGDIAITYPTNSINFYGFFFEEGSASVETLKAAKASMNGATYNVAGQQVDAAAKGLVIKDGKKFVNK